MTSPTAADYPVHHRYVDADGVRVFYREAGNPKAPTLLLLHGFPTSSVQYRELIAELKDQFHIVAPDLPGFGFTEVPEDRKYEYTFDSLGKTLEAFVDALGLQSYIMYVFDYGAPSGLRLAVARPERLAGLISQNGNAYAEGLGDAWNPIRQYWNEPTQANRDALREACSLEGIRWQYIHGVANPERVAPEGYTLDTALVARPGNIEIQLDLFKDYANNLKLYPAFQQYFRDQQPPLLALWGKHDPFFLPAGAEAFRKDIPSAEIELLDTGHFALETHVEYIASQMLRFLARVK